MIIFYLNLQSCQVFYNKKETSKIHFLLRLDEKSERSEKRGNIVEFSSTQDLTQQNRSPFKTCILFLTFQICM